MPIGDPATWLTAALALLGVLGLAVLFARGARLAGLGPTAAGRRLALTGTLALDARRRILLVRCDGREVLLLTGGGRDVVLGWIARESRP
jgi:flagellar protein FliO/FliZ